MENRLNDRAVKAIPVPAAGYTIAWDGELPGFGVRVTKAGAKAFVLNYRVDGRERRFTIGKFPAWTTSAARIEAARLRRRVDGGEDPLVQRLETRHAPTIADLCDAYLASPKAIQKRTLEEDRRRIERAGGIREKLGRRLVAKISAAEIAAWHRQGVEAPYEANRQLALLSTMFSLAAREKWRGDNPCASIGRFDEARRERYLTKEELGRLAAALDEYPNQVAANAIRLLVLTGARRGEVLRATWGQFDLEAGAWVKPSSHTKTKREHRVPLSPQAVELLQEMRRDGNGSAFVFPGRRPEEPLRDIKRPWATICKRAGIEGVRVHDLRHSFASILASAGLSLLTIGRLLGHSQASTTERYSHFFDDPLRQATAHVGRFVASATRGKRRDG